MNTKEVVFDTYSLLTLQTSSRLRRKTPDSYAEHKEAKSSVILIPGFFEQWGLLRKIANAVSRRGHDVYTVPRLGENLYDIKTASDKIEHVIQLNHLLGSTIIGHSYGGIIGYDMIHRHPSFRLITIATPFSGSDVAKHIPLTRSIRAMSPQSSVLQGLIDTSSDTNKNVVSIFPKSDNFIPNGSYLAGAENIEIDTFGHHNILRHDDVVGRIIRKLEYWEAERLRR